jgi:hypothetical protein
MNLVAIKSQVANFLPMRLLWLETQVLVLNRHNQNLQNALLKAERDLSREKWKNLSLLSLPQASKCQKEALDAIAESMDYKPEVSDWD